MENKEQIDKLAYFDSLTGLPNRRKLVECLKEITQPSDISENHYAVAFIDIDNFKNLNDSLVHHTGDKLL